MTKISCQVCGNCDIEYFCTAVDRVREQPDPVWRIERCRKCGFGRTSPPLPEDQIASYYPPTYLGNTIRALDEFFNGKLQKSRSWREEIGKTRLVARYCLEGRILDVGCGDGKFLWALDSSRWDRAGIELSGETLTQVRARMPGLRLIEGDLFHPALEQGSFDVCTFWHVFEHLPNPPRVLCRAWSLLRPGGHILISVPRLDSLQAVIFRKYWYPFDDVPRHLYHFSQRSMTLLLTAAKFNVRGHHFFSRRVNFHSLKHSLLNWSRESFGSRMPYYLLKPFLLPWPLLEGITNRYGILTTVAQKPMS